MCEDINDVNFNLNGKFDNFYEKVHTTVIQHAPLKKVNQKQLKLRTKPWVNPHIKKLINYRDKLLRKLRKSHSKNTEELYKKFRNRVVRKNRTSRKKYFETYFQTDKSNMKGLWAGINSIINSKFRKSVQNVSQLAVNSKTYSDPQKMASIINNFFVNVSNQVCSEIPRTKTSPLDYLMKRNSSSFFIKPITYIEIEEIISSFRNGKSTGPYSIPAKLFKMLSPYISQPLAIIFSASITLGVFPDNLKYAKVVPIHKKGSPSNPSNYRPISLLSVFSKIFEKLMYRRLYKFLDSMDAFYSLRCVKARVQNLMKNGIQNLICMHFNLLFCKSHHEILTVNVNHHC